MPRFWNIFGPVLAAVTLISAITTELTIERRCKTVVLNGLKENARFAAQLQDQVGAQDFLTTLTKEN